MLSLLSVQVSAIAPKPYRTANLPLTVPRTQILPVHGRRQQHVQTTTAAVAHIAEAAATNSTTAAFMPGTIFTCTAALMVPVYAMMIFAPDSKLTRGLVTSPILPLGLSLLYIYLLAKAMSGGLVDSFAAIFKAVKGQSLIPDLTAMASLLGNPVVTNLTWVHLLLLDFYQSRAVFMDGLQSSVATGHSIALCFLFGPLGLLSHFITRALKSVATGRPAGPENPSIL